MRQTTWKISSAIRRCGLASAGRTQLCQDPVHQSHFHRCRCVQVVSQRTPWPSAATIQFPPAPRSALPTMSADPHSQFFHNSLQAPNTLALATFALVELFLAIFERLLQKPRITYRNNNHQSSISTNYYEKTNITNLCNRSGRRIAHSCRTQRLSATDWSPNTGMGRLTNWCKWATPPPFR